jgi:hypothetical protein
MRENHKMIAVPAKYIEAVRQTLAEYDRELCEIEHSVYLPDEQESVACQRDGVLGLIRMSNTALGEPSLVEWEQQCDQCGCDLDEIWVEADGLEVCKDCFEKGATE